MQRIYQFRNLKTGVDWTNCTPEVMEEMKKFLKQDPTLGLEFSVMRSYDGKLFVEEPSKEKILEMARKAGMFGFEDQHTEPLLRFAQAMFDLGGGVES